MSVPGQAVVQRQIPSKFPSVLYIQPVLTLVDAVTAKIGRGLLRVSDADAGEDAAAQTQEGRVPVIIGGRQRFGKAQSAI